MSNKKQKEITVREAPKEDWFLQNLVHIVNICPIGFGITLNVGGFLVSGNLFGGKGYFEKFGTDFAAIFQDIKLPKAQQEKLKKDIAEYGSIYNKNQKSMDPINPPAYIHLQNAKFFTTTGKPMPHNRTVLWRGRIAEIQGFFFGILKEEKT